MCSYVVAMITFKSIKFSDLTQVSRESAEYAAKVHAMQVWAWKNAFLLGPKSSFKLLCKESGETPKQLKVNTFNYELSIVKIK